jgi:oligoribonuclease
MIEFLAAYVPAGKSPMCGNSICQDRRFMANHMKGLEAFFHYRNLDVSTLKELARRWKPARWRPGQGQQAHRAGRHPRVHRRVAALPPDLPGG